VTISAGRKFNTGITRCPPRGLVTTRSYWSYQYRDVVLSSCLFLIHVVRACYTSSLVGKL